MSLAVLLLAGRAVVTIRDADVSDFRCFYAAGQLVREARDPYDAATWATAVYTDPARVPHCAGSFVYPLVTALAFVPLTFVPEATAVALWEAVLIACVVVGAALASRTWATAGGPRLLVAMLLWAQPTFSAVANAQFGPLLFLGVAALAFALERARAGTALASWLVLVVKPHLTALVLVATLVGRGARWTLVAVGTAALLFVVSIALVPSWPAEFIDQAVGQRLLADRGLSSLWTLAQDVGLPPVAGGLLAVALAVIGWRALPQRRFAPREVVAIAVAVTFVVTPYARPHDLDVLAVCWALALASAAGASARLRRAIIGRVVVAALVLPWAVTLVTQFGLPLASYVVVSLVTAVLTVVALRSSPAPQPLG